MKPTLVLGVLLFLFGLVMTAVSIGGVDEWATYVVGGSAWNMGLPVVSGLALATGALLIVLSFGNWRHPRSHVEPGDEIVDPEAFNKVRHV